MPTLTARAAAVRDEWLRVAEVYANPQPADLYDCQGICVAVYFSDTSLACTAMLRMYGVPWLERVSRGGSCAVELYFAPMTPGKPDDARTLFALLMAAMVEAEGEAAWQEEA